MAEFITGRLQTPADDAGKRKDIHIFTSVDCVLLNPKTSPDGSLDDEANKTTLEEKLQQLTFQVNTGKPEFPSIWAKVKRQEPTVEIITE